MKAALLGLARTLGYDIRRRSDADAIDRLLRAEARVTELEKTVGDVDRQLHQALAKLNDSETMRTMHQRDAIEIEELLRLAALPDLPARAGREKQLSQLIGTTVSEALYIVDALHKSFAVPGDICEFGVAQGATSLLIAAELLHTDRDFWLFDSFEGLPQPTAEDHLIDDIFALGSMQAYAGTMRSPEAEVRTRLDSLPFPRERTMIRKGWVNDTIAGGDVPKRVAFAYVDFDFYEPIRDALAYLDTVTPVGARIVVDDYGFFSEGAQLATDQFVQGCGKRWTLDRPLALAGHFVTLAKVA